jgi:hypothetical protein
LILYLGDRPNDRSLSEWRLHVEPAWRLEGPTGPLVGSFDASIEDRPPDWVMESLRSMMGRTVEGFAVGSPVLDLRIDFTGGYKLLSFAHSIADGENWEVRHASGLRIAMRAVTECVEFREDPDRSA